MVSFDVESLFTNIPLIESINLAVDYIMKGNPDIKLGRENLAKLFFFATAQTHFSFLGNFYDQIDGVAMGSPLAPVLANLFMGHQEKRWLESYNSGIKKSHLGQYFDPKIQMWRKLSSRRYTVT